MKIGGYKIIDFGNDAFTAGTAKDVAGAYEAFTGNKPVIIEGLKIGTAVIYPFFAPAFTQGDSKVTSAIPGYTVEVTKADKVKFTAIV
ncbi:MAG: hypothetical protein MJZ20_09480 [Bacteroidaceae bacterium]|nr:hypothetical protein [Bacteroidaceae bacterium]